MKQSTPSPISPASALTASSQTPDLQITPTLPFPLPSTSATGIHQTTVEILSASAKMTQNWNSYRVEGYSFSFLYPKHWQVNSADANHLQVLYKNTMLTIGYRLVSDKKVSLAPVIKQVENSTRYQSFNFLGEAISIAMIVQTDSTGGGQSAWKAIYYDGGGEVTRGQLVFTLRLENIDKSKTLASLSPDEVHAFDFIIGSFMIEPERATHPDGTQANLAKLGLAQAQSIEIGVFNPDISVNRYLYQHLINDPTLIRRLVETLDSDINVHPAVECIEAYELIFLLADNRRVTFGYKCSGQPAALTRGFIEDGSFGLGGSITVSTEFVEMLQPEIAKAELLRDNNAPPVWKTRIVEHDGKVGPFTLEEYQILDTGRWGPSSLEFRAIIPDRVFARRADLREGEGLGWPIPSIQLNGHTIEVNETWGQTMPHNYAVVQQDGIEIFRIPTRGPAGTSPVKGLWAWNGQWVLEVDSHIVIDGKELNATLGAQESFDWQIMAGKPFAFIIKEDQVNAWYDGKLYPLGYDQVVHNRCCEAGMFNPGHNAQMVWFYAHKESGWRYVEMGLY